MNNMEHIGFSHPKERQTYILSLLQERHAVSVKELARELYLNEATVRRDLNALARTGAISRTYGGALLSEGADFEVPFFIRQTSHPGEKKRIAELASAAVHDGETLFIDSSSTAAVMIDCLRGKRGLRIVTNGVKVLERLSRLEDCEAYCIGGRLRENDYSLVGSAATELLRRYHFDAAFFSCRGIHREAGLTDSNPEEAELRSVVLARSTRRYALLDHTKFDTVCFCHICPVDTLDALFTDRPLSEEWEEYLRACGTRACV